MEAKISSKNQIVIPKECREILGTSAGDSVLLIPKGNVVLMMKQSKNPSKRLKGLLGGKSQLNKILGERERW